MRQINKLFIALLLFAFLAIQTAEKSPAEQNYPFSGKINEDNINVRADSTVSATVICKLNKGDDVEVLSESYGWYKIKLPKTTPSFIKSDLADPLDDKTARILKNSVNIRLEPNESSLILGKVEKEEIINILEKTGDWYRIEPIDNSFAWVNNKFVDKADFLKISAPDNQAPKSIIIEGIIRSYGKVFKRQATHKLISQDSQVFLLKGNKETLDALNGRRVKVSGKLITAAQQKYPVIEIEKIIAQDKNNESVN